MDDSSLSFKGKSPENLYSNFTFDNSVLTGDGKSLLDDDDSADKLRLLLLLLLHLS